MGSGRGKTRRAASASAPLASGTLAYETDGSKLVVVLQPERPGPNGGVIPRVIAPVDDLLAKQGLVGEEVAITITPRSTARGPAKTLRGNLRADEISSLLSGGQQYALRLNGQPLNKLIDKWHGCEVELRARKIGGAASPERLDPEVVSF